MDEDRPIDFKSLRAKFQVEGLLPQCRASRPAVAEKPRHLPSPGGHGSLVVSNTNAAAESNTPVVPRVVFSDGLWSSGGRQSISFPPQQSSPSARPANGDGTRQSLRDRNMPLVLPVLPLKDQKMDPTEREHKLEPGKEVWPQNKFKKKGMLLPFRSVKATAEHEEGPTVGSLTNRASSDPGVSPSKKPDAEHRVWLHTEQVDSEPRLSSPEISMSPRPSESRADSDNGTGSTMDRAKKFSRRQMVLSAKTSILCSPDRGSMKNPRGLGFSTPATSCFPHLACISARPFSKANSAPWKPTFEFQLGKAKSEQLSRRTAGPNLPSSPLKKPLPDLSVVGPAAAKPPRPSVVDLASFSLAAKGASSGQSHKEYCEHTLSSSPVLGALQIPDFEDSEVDPAMGEAVDILALELETLDVVCADVEAPVQFAGANPEAPEPAWEPAEICVSAAVPDLNLGSPNIIPLDPAHFPEPITLLDFPEQQPHSRAPAGDTFSNSYDTDVGAAESQFLPEEAHLSEDQQDNYSGTSDVYEDVENITRFISGQVSTKQKSKIKNPYADNPVKEEQYANKQLRHQWGSITGEHAASHAYGEQSSPDSTVYKEQRKREKQRLEKERKEQKEREKKENEMKKKFKVSGNEAPMYHAKVKVAGKVRKNDLPVKIGDTVGIIRTTNCPKGKWLARDANYKYGYISVMNVELNIKKMIELGKKAQAACREGNKEADTISIGSRSSTHPVLTSSFTDDSEEWACEDTLSPFIESHVLQQSASEPDMSCVYGEAQQTVGDTNLEDLHTQIRHEALQKLAFFLQSTKNEPDHVPDGGGANSTKYSIIPNISQLVVRGG